MTPDERMDAADELGMSRFRCPNCHKIDFADGEPECSRCGWTAQPAEDEEEELREGEAPPSPESIDPLSAIAESVAELDRLYSSSDLPVIHDRMARVVREFLRPAMVALKSVEYQREQRLMDAIVEELIKVSVKKLAAELTAVVSPNPEATPPICETCGRRKTPRGVDTSFDLTWCDQKCRGYEGDPLPALHAPGLAEACQRVSQLSSTGQSIIEQRLTNALPSLLRTCPDCGAHGLTDLCGPTCHAKHSPNCEHAQLSATATAIEREATPEARPDVEPVIDKLRELECKVRMPNTCPCCGRIAMVGHGWPWCDQCIGPRNVDTGKCGKHDPRFANPEPSILTGQEYAALLEKES